MYPLNIFVLILGHFVYPQLNRQVSLGNIAKTEFVYGNISLDQFCCWIYDMLAQNWHKVWGDALIVWEWIRLVSSVSLMSFYYLILEVIVSHKTCPVLSTWTNEVSHFEWDHSRERERGISIATIYTYFESQMLSLISMVSMAVDIVFDISLSISSMFHPPSPQWTWTFHCHDCLCLILLYFVVLVSEGMRQFCACTCLMHIRKVCSMYSIQTIVAFLSFSSVVIVSSDRHELSFMLTSTCLCTSWCQ